MTTDFDKLVLALWAGHSRGLHGSIHGVAQAQALALTEGAFDQSSAHTKAAMRGATITVLHQLRVMYPDNERLGACLDSIVFPVPKLSIQAAPPPEAPPKADAPPNGWAGDLPR